MTSVFYDVIRLESVRGRSIVVIEGHFDGFCEFKPENVVAIVLTQKGTSLRQSACFEKSRVKFNARLV